MKDRILGLQNEIIRTICSTLPNTFWDHKSHTVELPYEKDFNEKNIPTKARPS